MKIQTDSSLTTYSRACGRNHSQEHCTEVPRNTRGLSSTSPSVPSANDSMTQQHMFGPAGCNDAGCVPVDRQTGDLQSSQGLTMHCGRAKHPSRSNGRNGRRSASFDKEQRYTCDFHSFTSQARLHLEPSFGQSLKDLTLANLWSWFEDGSLFGRPVPTSSCELGESIAFFVPLLSAMKLYTTDRIQSATSRGHETSGHSQCRCRYSGKHTLWTSDMYLLANYHARRLPWDRRPMYDELQCLSAQDPSTDLPLPEALFSTPLTKIHPCSWFAVWWQPLYRIPDMPLDVKFLAYYSFESLHQLLCLSPRRKQSYDIPVAGLLCGGVESHRTSSDGDEHWLRPRFVDGQYAASSGDLANELAIAEEAFLTELRHLHSVAQQLTLDCKREVTYLDLPDHAVEDLDAHKDFLFLQRGRMR